MQGELVKFMKGVVKLVLDLCLKQKFKDMVGIGIEVMWVNIISGLLMWGYFVKKGCVICVLDVVFILIDVVFIVIVDLGIIVVWEQVLDMIEVGQFMLDVFIGKQVVWILQLIVQYGSMFLFIKVFYGLFCLQCGVLMCQCIGKSGLFWLCSCYFDCKGMLLVEFGMFKCGVLCLCCSGCKGF